MAEERPNIMGTTNGTVGGHEWPGVHASGVLKGKLGPDILVLSQPMPAPGGHLLTYNKSTVYCKIVTSAERKTGQTSTAVFLDDEPAVNNLLASIV